MTEPVAQRAPIQFPPRVPVLLQATPRLLREHSACADGYRKAIKGAGLGPDDNDTPINLLSILESNGLPDFHWALRAVLPEQEADRDRVARLLAAEYAARVLPLFEAERPDDDRPRLVIEAARDFALGEIGDAAWDAGDAAWDAGDAAWDAGDAAWDAGDAAWDAARDAARAAWDAAGAAARATKSHLAAARDAWAAWDAEQQAQRDIITAYLRAE